MRLRSPARPSRDRSEYLEKVELVAEQIEQGNFYKRPGKWCRQCEFLPLEMCRYATNPRQNRVTLPEVAQGCLVFLFLQMCSFRRVPFAASSARRSSGTMAEPFKPAGTNSIASGWKKTAAQ